MNVSSPPFRSCQSDYTRGHFKEIKKIRHEGFKYCSAFCVKKNNIINLPETQNTVNDPSSCFSLLSNVLVALQT